MFFIIGWNHKVTTTYGVVQEHQCINCKKNDLWELNKISIYTTLFFIPIFRDRSEYWYQCPACKYGITLNKDLFNNYKLIAKINLACSEEKISEIEKEKQLTEVYKKIDQDFKTKKHMQIEESKDFYEQVKAKTNEELNIILYKKRNDYNPAFIIAVEEEMKKRTKV